ncbi:MAG TPA: DUF222 domain-containing protein [Acidimicrobiales bacterium]|jgi:hypothetical protein|nr:DUF222 domain-containing protein [Acidimicrobiales bacterium]
MLTALADAIRDLQIPVDSATLRAAVALHDRLGAKVTAAIGEFDALRMWDADCAMNMKSWLTDEGVAGQDAHRAVAYGKRMIQLPKVSAMWQSGELSNGQVRAICENLVDKHIGRFQLCEDAFVPALVGLSVKETNHVMATWRAHADALDDELQGDPELSLQFSHTLDGRYVMNGSFDPVNGDAIAAALAVADSDDLAVPASRRKAEALARIARHFLDHHDVAVSPRQRPQVSIVIDAFDLAELSSGRGHGHAFNPDTGARYDAATVSRYLCDCSLNTIIAEKLGKSIGRVLDVGRSQRTATPAQRIALAVRDQGCRWTGCTMPPGWCEAHHLDPWELGGATDLDNLGLFCGGHHDLIHRKGIELKLLPDATIVATFLDGTTQTMRPPGSSP